MTFDAGSIEASFDVDRTAFQQGLAAAKREAEEFAAKKYGIKIDVDADTSRARSAMRALRTEANRDIRVNVSTNQADTRIAALRQQMQSLSGDAKKAGEDGASGLNAMLDAAVVLGPALVPLAEGVGGLASGLAGDVLTLGLAVKGVQADIAANNAEGRAFKSVLTTANQGLQQLEQTAAKGVLTPFQREMAQINSQIPQFNSFIGKMSATAGDTAAHGVNTLVNLLTAAEPLIVDASHALDQIFARFDTWSQGDGAAKFFATLDSEIPVAVDVIGNLFTTITNLLSAVTPVGQTVLDTIDGISSVLSDIPVPILTAVVTGLVAWRLAAIGSAAATALVAATSGKAATAAGEETVALRAQAIAAAQAEAAMYGLAGANGAAGASGLAAARSGGMRIAGGAAAASALRGGAAAEGEGSLLAGAAVGGGLLARAGAMASKAIVPLLIGYFVSGALHNATKGSTGVGAAEGAVFSDLFRPWQAGAATRGYYSDVRAEQQNALDQRDINRLNERYFGTQQRYAITSYGPQGTASNTQQYERSYGYRYAQSQDALNIGQAHSLGAMTNPSSIASGQQAVTAAIQARIEAEQALFKAGKENVTLDGDMKVSTEQFRRVYAAFGNDYAKTVDYFRGHSIALTEDAVALQDVTTKTARYNDFLTQSSMKYNLTSQQVTAYATALGLTYDKVTATTQSEQQAVSIMGMLNERFANGNGAVQGWLSAISQVDLSTDTLTQRVSILGAGLSALQGVQNSMALSNLTAADDIEKVANAIEQNSHSVGRHGQLLGQLVDVNGRWIVQQPKLTAGSLKISEAMAKAGTSAIQLAQSIYQNTGSAEQAFAAYSGLRQQFIDTEIGAGRTRQAAERLANQIYGIPKNAKTFVDLLNKDNVAAAIRSLTGQLVGFGKIISKALVALTGADHAKAQLNDIISALGLIDRTTARPHVAPVYTPPVDLPGGVHYPGVGTPPPNSSGSGSRRYTGATGRYIDRGTTPTADDVPIWVSKGEYVVNAAATARHFALIDAINRGTFVMPGFAAGGSPSLITQPTAPGHHGSHSGSHSRSAATATATKLTNLINQLVGLLGNDLPQFAGLATASVAQARSTFDAIFRDLQKAYVAHRISLAALQRFRTGEFAARADIVAYNRGQQQIAKDQGVLSNVTNERNNIINTTRSGFDIGTSGNGYKVGIMSSLDKQLADAKKFESYRAQAVKLGLSKTLLAQITSEGPEQAGKNLEAIVKGGKSYVTSIDSKYAALTGVGQRLGDAQTKTLYGTTQAALTAKIHAEGRAQTALQRKIKDELAALRNELAALRTDIKNRKRV